MGKKQNHALMISKPEKWTENLFNSCHDKTLKHWMKLYVCSLTRHVIHITYETRDTRKPFKMIACNLRRIILHKLIYLSKGSWGRFWPQRCNLLNLPNIGIPNDFTVVNYDRTTHFEFKIYPPPRNPFMWLFLGTLTKVKLITLL